MDVAEALRLLRGLLARTNPDCEAHKELVKVIQALGGIEA